MAVSKNTRLVSSGPLLVNGDGVTIDPKWKPQFRATTTTVTRKIAEAAQQRLNVMATQRPRGVYLSFAQGGKSSGFYRQNITIRRDGRAHVVTDRGVVYGPWLEGTSSRNQSTRFKGYGMFRRTAQWARKNAFKIASVEVAKLTTKMNVGK